MDSLHNANVAERSFPPGEDGHMTSNDEKIKMSEKGRSSDPIQEEASSGEYFPSTNEDSFIPVRAPPVEDDSSTSSDVEILEKESFEEQMTDSLISSFSCITDPSQESCTLPVSPADSHKDIKTSSEDESRVVIGSGVPIGEEGVNDVAVKDRDGNAKVQEANHGPCVRSCIFGNGIKPLPFFKLLLVVLGASYLLQQLNNASKHRGEQVSLQKMEATMMEFFDEFQMEFFAFRLRQEKVYGEMIRRLRQKGKCWRMKVKRVLRALRKLDHDLSEKGRNHGEVVRNFALKLGELHDVINFYEDTFEKVLSDYREVGGKISRMGNRSLAALKSLGKSKLFKNMLANISRIEEDNRRLRSLLHEREKQESLTVNHLGQKLKNLTLENEALKTRQERRRGVYVWTVKPGLEKLRRSHPTSRKDLQSEMRKLATEMKRYLDEA